MQNFYKKFGGRLIHLPVGIFLLHLQSQMEKEDLRGQDRTKYWQVVTLNQKLQSGLSYTVKNNVGVNVNPGYGYFWYAFFEEGDYLVLRFELVAEINIFWGKEFVVAGYE